MILGIGVDLVDVPRMERTLGRRWGQRFVEKVFSLEEQTACCTASQPAQCYAARFAAKEALVKALGTGFSQGVSPSQIRVLGGEHSRPHIELHGRARQAADSLHVTVIHVSLTHTSTTACAFVVLEAKPDRTD